MKKALLILVAGLMSLTAGAVPVKPGLWQTLMLADGTTVRAEAHGSEHGFWWEDQQGQCYILQYGEYVKIERETLKGYFEQAHQTRRANGQRRILGTATDDGMGYPGRNSWGNMPSNGEWDIPVLMVEFTDAKFKPEHTEELINDYLVKENFYYSKNSNSRGSIRDYFVVQSQGKFKPNFKLLGKVTIDKPYAYYGADDTQDPTYRDVHCSELAGDAMRAAVQQLQDVDFKQFSKPAPDKWHKDGIPLICMLYPGHPQSANPEKTDLIWPHELDVDITVDGIHLSSYFVGNELAERAKYDETTGEVLSTEEQLEGIGTFCHELGHALGLPDWYCTNDSYKGDDAFGNWSIMDHGCYAGDSWVPTDYTAYERSHMGWLSIEPEDQKTTVQLTSPSGSRPAMVIYNPYDQKEYFILETRQPSTWYPESLGTGLLLTRYAFDENVWMDDAPNNIQTMKRGLVITADNAKLNYSASSTNLFGNGVNEITGQTFRSGTELNVTITNIQKNADGSITFDYDPAATAIRGIETSANAENESYHDLQGRRVTNLSKGIYIHDGKKVVIR